MKCVTISLPRNNYSRREFFTILYFLNRRTELQRLVAWAKRKRLTGPRRHYEYLLLFITETRETKTRSKDQSDELRIYINPKIVETSKEEVIIYEGCGSVLNGQLFGPVKRPRTITIEAFSRDGKKFRFTADGILGRVIQHEYDHLQGIEFLEKVYDYKKLMTVEHYLDQIKNNPDHNRASIISIKEFELIS